MQIALGDRTAETAVMYFEKTRDPEIRRFLPQKARTAEEALEDFRETQAPGARSFGRTILVDGTYVGDVWCYCMDPEGEPQAMVSYCVFEKTLWGRGISAQALGLFLNEVRERFGFVRFGAFTFSRNTASIRVLEKNGFHLAETFTEDGVESGYYERLEKLDSYYTV